MNYRLVALDIDGTILTTEEELTPRTRRAIMRVRERGVPVVLATGRRLIRTLPWAQALGLTQPLIVHNGAVIYDQASGKILNQEEIDLKVAHSIQQELETRFLNYVIYTGESAGEEVLAPSGTWQEPENLLLRYLGENAEFVDKVHLQVAPVRISIVDRPQKVDPFYEVLTENYGDQVNAMLFGAERDKWRGIEIIPHNCSKGTGLAYLAESLKIPQASVVAIGDNVNDLEMILWAGLGVAMENGSPELKAQAKQIAPSNDRDGVAEVLEELFL
ncbi:MAG: HAD family phosphatase [Firmicutes bacterium]|nr:HAD family phosphatase [Bacillota bacterium]